MLLRSNILFCLIRVIFVFPPNGSKLWREIVTNVFFLLSTMGGNHTLNRAKLCLICAGRASILITTVLLEVIRNVLIQDFTLENPCFPSGLCWTYGRTLYEYAKGKLERMIPERFDYSQMRNYRPRRDETVCNCMICDMAENRSRFGAKNSKKGHVETPKSWD